MSLVPIFMPTAVRRGRELSRDEWATRHRILSTRSRPAREVFEKARVPVRTGIAGGSLAALQAELGHGSSAVTERYGTIGDDLVEREAKRLVEFRAQGGVR